MSDHTDISTLKSLCQDVNTPRSLAVYIMLKYKAHAEYLKLEIDASHYEESAAFRSDYLVTKYLSKWKGFKTGDDLNAKTIAGWFASEQSCALTNKRFRNCVPANQAVTAIMSIATQKITHILGRLPRISALIDHCGWSKGGTVDLRRGTDFTTKMTSKLTVTSSAVKYMATAIGTDPIWCESIGIDSQGPCTLLSSNFTITNFNKHMMVPKNAKVHRNISIEPTANIYLQKGIGKIIRGKLARVGIDLDDQTLNQRLARGALQWGLCTIDLTSASDMIAKLLVRDLLPIDWYLLLDDLRSKSTQVAGKNVVLEKFSSQGNGFTFELESLIFFAITSATNEYLGLSNFFTNVFGDDIITNNAAYPLIVEVLEYCGFVVNTQKSFSSGLFYESCGKHYFNDEEVTPVYQKEISDKREEIIRTHNRLVRYVDKYSISDDVFKDARRIQTTKFNKFKDEDVPRIPRSNVSDDGFLTFPAYLLHYCVNHGWHCNVYRFSTRLKQSKEIAFFSRKLHHPNETSSSDQKGQAKTSSSVNGFYSYKRAWINL